MARRDHCTTNKSQRRDNTDCIAMNVPVQQITTLQSVVVGTCQDIKVLTSQRRDNTEACLYCTTVFL